MRFPHCLVINLIARNYKSLKKSLNRKRSVGGAVLGKHEKSTYKHIENADSSIRAGKSGNARAVDICSARFAIPDFATVYFDTFALAHDHVINVVSACAWADQATYMCPDMGKCATDLLTPARTSTRSDSPSSPKAPNAIAFET